MQGVTQTVWRALGIIEAFDNLDRDEDWQDVPSPVYRKYIGERYEHPRLLETMWLRYKKGSLQAEVEDLAANIVMEDVAEEKRKEIKDGLDRIRKAGRGRGKR